MDCFAALAMTVSNSWRVGRVSNALQRGFRGIAEKTVQRRHHLRALADRAADPLDRSRAHIADREYAGYRGFQRRHRSSQILLGLRAGHHEAPAIERDPATI